MNSDDSHPSWKAIDSQAELSSLDASINWDDAEAVAFVGQTDSTNSLLPTDVARSGYINWNVRVLLFVADRRGSHLEVMLIDCDDIGPGLFAGWTLSGRVDSLKRIEITDSAGERRLRCSRLAYRFIDVDQQEARAFYGFGKKMPGEGAG